MKLVLKSLALFTVALCLIGCTSRKELRRLENSYQEQLSEYAEELKAGELTKAEHDKKVTLLNSRYGNRRAQLEREIYGTGTPRNRRAVIPNPGRRY